MTRYGFFANRFMWLCVTALSLSLVRTCTREPKANFRSALSRPRGLRAQAFAAWNELTAPRWWRGETRPFALQRNSACRWQVDNTLGPTYFCISTIKCSRARVAATYRSNRWRISPPSNCLSSNTITIARNSSPLIRCIDPNLTPGSD